MILFGNPIVSSVAPRTFEKLDKAQEDGRVLNVVRTVPTMKSKAGYHAYTDFRLTQVVEAKMPTAAQWKAAGNAALFAEDDWREHLMPRDDDGDDDEGIDDEEEVVEMTRGYQDREDGDDHEYGHEEDREGPSFFLTGVDAGGRARGGAGGGAGAGIWDDEEEDEGEGDTLMMPTNLLQPSFIKGETKRDPGKLRSAINALRYALKHPTTGVNDKLPGNIGYMKTTGAVRAKQMPRIEYKGRPKRGRGGGAEVGFGHESGVGSFFLSFSLSLSLFRSLFALSLYIYISRPHPSPLTHPISHIPHPSPLTPHPSFPQPQGRRTPRIGLQPRAPEHRVRTRQDADADGDGRLGRPRPVQQQRPDDVFLDQDGQQCHERV